MEISNDLLELTIAALEHKVGRNEGGSHARASHSGGAGEAVEVDDNGGEILVQITFDEDSQVGGLTDFNGGVLASTERIGEGEGGES